MFEMYVNVVFVIRYLYSPVSLTLVREKRFIILLCCSKTRVQDVLGQEYMLHQGKRQDVPQECKMFQDKSARCSRTIAPDVPGQKCKVYQNRNGRYTLHSQARDSDLFR